MVLDPNSLRMAAEKASADQAAQRGGTASEKVQSSIWVSRFA
jgi:hypothetical protein